MKHSIYLKFILIYLIFGLLSFFTIATFSSEMTLNHLTERKAEELYREANYISANFAKAYYSSKSGEASLNTIHSHFQALDTYLGASIWLLNTDGTLLVDSDSAFLPPKTVWKILIRQIWEAATISPAAFTGISTKKCSL